MQDNNELDYPDLLNWSNLACWARYRQRQVNNSKICICSCDDRWDSASRSRDVCGRETCRVRVRYHQDRADRWQRVWIKKTNISWWIDLQYCPPRNPRYPTVSGIVVLRFVFDVTARDPITAFRVKFEVCEYDAIHRIHVSWDDHPNRRERVTKTIYIYIYIYLFIYYPRRSPPPPSSSSRSGYDVVLILTSHRFQGITRGEWYDLPWVGKRTWRALPVPPVEGTLWLGIRSSSVSLRSDEKWSMTERRNLDPVRKVNSGSWITYIYIYIYFYIYYFLFFFRSVFLQGRTWSCSNECNMISAYKSLIVILKIMNSAVKATPVIRYE